MTTSWDFQEKVGRGSWEYNEANFDYDQDKDSNNNDVRYDYIGTETSWSYQSKS